MSSSTRARSLADDLRQRDRPSLIALLTARPDLVSPLPESMSELARRAATGPSVRMALHQLDMRALAVAQAVSADPVTVEVPEIAARLELPDEEALAVAEAGVERLHELGLIWRDGQRGHVLREFPPTVHTVCAGRTVAPSRAAVSPHVSRETDPERIDRLAGDRGVLAVAEMREFLESLHEPVLTVTRDGRVAQRDLAAVAEKLKVSQSRVAMWLELGWLAGLLGPAGDAVRVTEAGRRWCAEELSTAWPVLVQTWWWSDRDWGAFDHEEAERPHVFGDSHLSSAAASVRRLCLEVLSEVPPGTSVDNLAEVIVDRHPLSWGGLMSQRLGALLAAACAQAEMLGVTALGALSCIGRALGPDTAKVDVAQPNAAEDLVEMAASILPQLTDRILVQADHTIIAPGPLQPQLADQMRQFADVESVGGATVYRLTAGSIGRALTAGLTSAEILGLLTAHSDVPIPQPVAYFVEDVCQRHGRVQVGATSSYLVTEDAATMTAVMAALGDSTAAVERLCDTVVVSHGDPAALVAAARTAGYPALVRSAGEPTTLTIAPVPSPPAVVQGIPATRLSAAADILLADGAPQVQLAEVDVPEVPRMHSAQILAVATRASQRGCRLWVCYATNAGATTTRLVSAVVVGSGVIEGFDLERGKVHKFALPRILGVVMEADAKVSP